MTSNHPPSAPPHTPDRLSSNTATISSPTSSHKYMMEKSHSIRKTISITHKAELERLKQRRAELEKLKQRLRSSDIVNPCSTNNSTSAGLRSLIDKHLDSSDSKSLLSPPRSILFPTKNTPETFINNNNDLQDSQMTGDNKTDSSKALENDIQEEEKKQDEAKRSNPSPSLTQEIDKNKPKLFVSFKPQTAIIADNKKERDSDDCKLSNPPSSASASASASGPLNMDENSYPLEMTSHFRSAKINYPNTPLLVMKLREANEEKAAALRDLARLESKFEQRIHQDENLVNNTRVIKNGALAMLICIAERKVNRAMMRNAWKTWNKNAGVVEVDHDKKEGMTMTPSRKRRRHGLDHLDLELSQPRLISQNFMKDTSSKNMFIDVSGPVMMADSIRDTSNATSIASSRKNRTHRAMFHFRSPVPHHSKNTSTIPKQFLQKAFDAVASEYSSSLAHYTIRVPTDEQKYYGADADVMNLETYKEVVDPNHPETFEIRATILADDSVLIIYGEKIVRHLRQDREEIRELKHEETNEPLGIVSYVDCDGIEMEYALDDIYEEAIVSRNSYCSSLLSSALVLQAVAESKSKQMPDSSTIHKSPLCVTPNSNAAPNNSNDHMYDLSPTKSIDPKSQISKSASSNDIHSSVTPSDSDNINMSHTKMPPPTNNIKDVSTLKDASSQSMNQTNKQIDSQIKSDPKSQTRASSTSVDPLKSSKSPSSSASSTKQLPVKSSIPPKENTTLSSPSILNIILSNIFTAIVISIRSIGLFILFVLIQLPWKFLNRMIYWMMTLIIMIIIWFFLANDNRSETSSDSRNIWGVDSYSHEF